MPWLSSSKSICSWNPLSSCLNIKFIRAFRPDRDDGRGIRDRGTSLTPTELRSACIELFGERGWQIGLARFLKRPGGHVNVRTVRRWTSGVTPVPFWVEPLVRAEMERGSEEPGADIDRQRQDRGVEEESDYAMQRRDLANSPANDIDVGGGAGGADDE